MQGIHSKDFVIFLEETQCNFITFTLSTKGVFFRKLLFFKPHLKSAKKAPINPVSFVESTVWAVDRQMFIDQLNYLTLAVTI